VVGEVDGRPEGGQVSARTLQQRLAELSPDAQTLLVRRLQLHVLERRMGETGSDQLVAYYETREGAEVLPGELRRLLLERLPRFMVPSRFVPVDNLPLLPNGKVDRQALLACRDDLVPRPAGRVCDPPADAVEAQMMRIFSDLIDVAEVGREDSFFELGGDSLLLPRLIDRIEGDFGVTFSLGVVFEAPTVRSLAVAVQARKSTSSWRSLVPIRAGGCRPPLYLVHGLGGEISYFYNFVPHLHPEQPVYALQPPADAYTALEPIAAHYIREIRLRQPTGPYRLGGYCLGGWIAFEMAHQLVEAGESVPLLMIIDSAVPGTRPLTPLLANRIRRLASSTPAEVLEKVKRRLKRASAPFERAREVPNDPNMLRWDSVPRAFHAVATRHYNALRDYTPRPLDTDVWLFRGEDDRFRRDLGWTPLVRGRLTIEMIPGDHANLLKDPYLPQAARKIGAVLDTIATGEPTPLTDRDTKR
jgi:thioesterase domain-containing protein/acyl carrier protein